MLKKDRIKTKYVLAFCTSFLKTDLNCVNRFKNSFNKGVYIRYVGGGRMTLQFFEKKFVAHENIGLNISRSSYFFGKYFMATPINFGFLFKAFL